MFRPKRVQNLNASCVEHYTRDAKHMKAECSTLSPADNLRDPDVINVHRQLQALFENVAF